MSGLRYQVDFINLATLKSKWKQFVDSEKMELKKEVLPFPILKMSEILSIIKIVSILMTTFSGVVDEGISYGKSLTR